MQPLSVMNPLYKKYYHSILNSKKNSDIQFVILMHVISDIAEFLSALDDIGTIAVIIAIPYSKDDLLYNALSLKYKTLTPALNNLMDSSYLKNAVFDSVDHERPVIIIEIGGYFSNAIADIQKKLNGSLMGVIEETEAGHRKYALIHEKFPCPVLSVARSKLKEAENILVGASCIKAADSVLNSLNLKSLIQNILILGYGKIGQSIANISQHKKQNIYVYDPDSSKKVFALARGFKIPEKSIALSKVDIIFGASGFQSIHKNDVQFIKNGCVLFSCSSKQVEFDMKFIKENYKKTTIQFNFDKYENSNHFFYVAADGHPINFSTGRILIGQISSIIYGEILLAIFEILNSACKNVLQEIPDEKKTLLAEMWIGQFCNPETGTYYYEQL